MDPDMILILAICIASVIVAGRQETSSGMDTEVLQQLNRLEQTLASSVVKGDLETWKDIVAADWITIDPAGRVLDRPRVLQELATLKRKIDSMTIDDVRVRRFGHVAIVTGRTTATGSCSGDVSRVVLRFTDVFVLRDGRWQVIASQGTIVAPVDQAHAIGEASAPRSGSTASARAKYLRHLLRRH
jgi:ketosteroid isomerase-like protein